MVNCKWEQDLLLILANWTSPSIIALKYSALKGSLTSFSISMKSRENGMFSYCSSSV